MEQMASPQRSSRRCSCGDSGLPLEQSSVSANWSIRYIKPVTTHRRPLTCVEKQGEEEDFDYHAGDIVFLVRNCIMRGSDTVKDAAGKLCRDFIKKYDRSVSNLHAMW